MRTYPGIPWGSGEAAFAVTGQLHAGCLQLFPVPELAGNLFVFLIESLAIIREFTYAYFRPPSELNLTEPIGVGQALPRGSDDVGITALEGVFRPIEAAHPANQDNRCLESGIAHRPADP